MIACDATSVSFAALLIEHDVLASLVFFTMNMTRTDELNLNRPGHHLAIKARSTTLTFIRANTLPCLYHRNLYVTLCHAPWLIHFEKRGDC